MKWLTDEWLEDFRICWLDVCMHGCMDAWMHGCMNAITDVEHLFIQQTLEQIG